MSVESLMPWQVALLTGDEIAALSLDDIASLSVPQLHQLSASQFRAFSAAQITALTPTQVNYILPAAFAALAPSVVAEFTPEQLAALRNSQASVMTEAEAAALSPTQVAALSVPVLKHLSVSALQALDGFTLDQVRWFPPAMLAELTAAQFSAFVAPNLTQLGAGRLVDLTAAQLATLTSDEVNALTAGKIGALSGAALSGLSAGALGALRWGLVQALTGDQLNGMGDAALSSLNPSYLSAAQIGSLTASTLAGLSAQAFAALLGGDVAALSIQALAGVSVADLAALGRSQAAAFTSSQLAAMNAAQLAALGQDPVALDLAARETNGSLSYSGALAVLQDAAKGGMTGAKFASLTSIAHALGSGAVQATAYVAQMFADVVLGNSANAWWTGGATSRVALGDLSATSSESQADELIGKWFLGTDRPNPSQAPYPLAYQQENLPLYGASGSPQMADVTQGQTGDCYFLASIAEIALQDPNAIENDIQANGNGTYSVRFLVDGRPDYVTVDTELPNLTGGWRYANGQTLYFDNGFGTLWSPLLEKAFAQLNEQQGVIHGADGVAANSYLDIAGGSDWPLTYLTGEQTSEYEPASNGADDHNLLTTLRNDLAGHGEVVMGTGSTVPAGSNLVADHMFAVTSVDANADTVSLFNPWNKNAGTLPATFTIAMSTLDEAGVFFGATSGRAA